MPRDGPLGCMLDNWKHYPSTGDKDKVKMIHYCIEIWGGRQISKGVYWPIFGSDKDWVRQFLNVWVNNKTPFNQEESNYAKVWLERPGSEVRLFPLKEKIGNLGLRKRSKKEEDIPCVPPPYISPQVPNAPPAQDQAEGLEEDPLPFREENPGVLEQVGPRTRSRTRHLNLYPLREIPMGGAQPGIGFISVPLNSGDVREFKREIGKLLEDPLGVAERLDQFLGPNTYTWEELQAILGILFTTEEKSMIRRAGMRIWDTQHAQGPQADTKWPLQNPNWNHQDPAHRIHMQDLRTIIIQGVREAVPRGQNINKAINERQKKDETPPDWLERLRRNMQMYSGLDPDSPAGQSFLKMHFVARSWDDIRKKLEKLENWEDRGLDELLREAQKVFVRRDDENQKKQARIMAMAVRETRKQNHNSPRRQEMAPRTREGNQGIERRSAGTCFYCGVRGHFRKDCRKRMKDNRCLEKIRGVRGSIYWGHRNIESP